MRTLACVTDCLYFFNQSKNWKICKMQFKKKTKCGLALFFVFLSQFKSNRCDCTRRNWHLFWVYVKTVSHRCLPSPLSNWPCECRWKTQHFPSLFRETPPPVVRLRRLKSRPWNISDSPLSCQYHQLITDHGISAAKHWRQIDGSISPNHTANAARARTSIQFSNQLLIVNGHKTRETNKLVTLPSTVENTDPIHHAQRET